MLEVIQYIFATGQDADLYYNRNNLLEDLLLGQQFSVIEVIEAIQWFGPILGAITDQNYYYTTKAQRDFDKMEKQLPASVINTAFSYYKQGIINNFERDIIIDRLSLMLNQGAETAELEEILENIIFHFNNYKFGLVMADIKSPLNYINNFTVH